MNRGLCASLVSILAASGCKEEPGILKIDASQEANAILRPLLTEYRARHPRDNIILWAGLGGSDAIRGVSTGLVDVAAVTVHLNEAEARQPGLEVHPIARSATLFGVNPGLPVNSLTRSQLCDLYSGAITTWRTLGGPDLPIKAGLSEPHDANAGNPIALLNCPRGFRFGPHVQMIDPPDAMANAISITPGGIGMTSLSILTKNTGRVKTIAVDGVAPTPENIATGKYRFARTTSLVTKAEPSRVFARLLRFMRSSDGRRIIRENGAIPID